MTHPRPATADFSASFQPSSALRKIFQTCRYSGKILFLQRTQAFMSHKRHIRDPHTAKGYGSRMPPIGSRQKGRNGEERTEHGPYAVRPSLPAVMEKNSRQDNFPQRCSTPSSSHLTPSLCRGSPEDTFRSQARLLPSCPAGRTAPAVR